jgi:hypothetical protein
MSYALTIIDFLRDLRNKRKRREKRLGASARVSDEPEHANRGESGGAAEQLGEGSGRGDAISGYGLEAGPNGRLPPIDRNAK